MFLQGKLPEAHPIAAKGHLNFFCFTISISQRFNQVGNK